LTGGKYGIRIPTTISDRFNIGLSPLLIVFDRFPKEAAKPDCSNVINLSIYGIFTPSWLPNIWYAGVYAGSRLGEIQEHLRAMILTVVQG
jgi:hypothetical protein